MTTEMLRIVIVAAGQLWIAGSVSAAQTAQPPAAPAPAPRPTPPTRDPNTPGYVRAKELPDGAVPATNADGNFIIGPTHNAVPEMTVQ